MNNSGEFYSTYKKDNEDFDHSTFQCAERTTQRLLETLTSSEHPGMLLGKVQSGKTRTFISILALAFDNEYDVAVVLTKNSKALVEQTFKRLGSEFSEFVEDREIDIYDIMSSPETFTAFELESKLIFVAKKQRDNLNRLIDMVSDSCPAMRDKKVLIIDDEADNASIGYSQTQGDIEANTIATQISDFRDLLPQCSFLQVTATPYSLYLQPTEIEVSNTADFKPTRPAFTELVPVPDAYVGGETYFGELARAEEDTLQNLIHHPVESRELERLKARDGRWYNEDEVLTTPHLRGFRHALVNFIVGGIILRINGIESGQKSKKLRYSFLIHSEAAKGAHRWQEDLTRHLVDTLSLAAQSGDAIFEELVQISYDDLSRSLLLDGQPVPPFSNVLQETKQGLHQEFVTISKVNSDEDVSSLLDDTGQLKLRSPLCIFIGGQVLDRGVTLAKLIGFYYGRRPQRFQQDTVLQHSRMYGYRRSELAVTRFYTSPHIRAAMQQMEEFDASLRSAIEAGGDRAVQFIRSAANGSVIPCSPNKILVATTQSLRPFRRIVPVGFQSGYKTGENGIGTQIDELDALVQQYGGFNSERPTPIPLAVALEFLNCIEPTLFFEDEDAPEFNWDSARAALCHLAQQHPNPAERDQVLLWAARDRNSGRLASERSHAKYIETPDSEKTEGRMTREYAVDHPMLFLLRQNGSKEKGWRGTPFYWPVVRAQRNAPTAIYTAETQD